MKDRMVIIMNAQSPGAMDVIRAVSGCQEVRESGLLFSDSEITSRTVSRVYVEHMAYIAVKEVKRG